MGYGDIRKLTSSFDGVMFAKYRAFDYFGNETQKKIREIVANHFLLTAIFVVLVFLYYYDVAGVQEIDKIFLTLSTFLFALFTGFFISRQARRYGDIRKLTSSFDGVMSATYRAFGHFGNEAQKKVGEIIANHYKMIIDQGWG